MKRILLMCCLLIAAGADAHDCEPSLCEKIKAEIRHVQSQMRQGYSAAKGIRLDEKLRKLRTRRNKACR